jgi:hypothetical protein
MRREMEAVTAYLKNTGKVKKNTYISVRAVSSICQAK